MASCRWRVGFSSLLLLTGLFACGGAGPAETAESFLNNIENGELSAAEKQLASSYGGGLSEQRRLEHVRRLHEVFKAPKDGPSLTGRVRFRTVEVQGEVAVVELELRENEAHAGTIELVRVDGGWKVAWVRPPE